MIEVQKRNPLFLVQAILLALFGLGAIAVYASVIFSGNMENDIESILRSIISIATSLLYIIPVVLIFKKWNTQNNPSSLRNLHILVGVIALAGLVSSTIYVLSENGFIGNWLFVAFNGMYVATVALFLKRSATNTTLYFSTIGWIRILFFAYAVATFQL
jgi:hypothetical protein